VNIFVLRDPLSEYDRPQSKIETCRKLMAYRIGGTARTEAPYGGLGLAPEAVAQEQ
jgi:hypothetical protein